MFQVIVTLHLPTHLVRKIPLWFTWLIVAAAAIAHGAASPTVTLDIPAGPAIETLKRFANQSGAQLLYSASAVEGISTQAVSGKMASAEALRLMLASTPLRVEVDAKNGALSVVRTRKWEVLRLLPQPKAPRNPTQDEADSIVALSRFEVNSARDHGYVATSTMAGSRLNSDLWDTPASISVFTAEFLEDAGLLDVRSALVYMLNASEDTTDYTGQALAANDINIQIRGFVGAAAGRNYFLTRLSTDRFNIERVDISRGPNSVLFGVGSPGGIVNTSTKRARIGTEDSTVRF